MSSTSREEGRKGTPGRAGGRGGRKRSRKTQAAVAGSAETRAPPDNGTVPRVHISQDDFHDALHAALSETGVCVVKGVATPEELAAGEELFWAWAERTTQLGIKRDDVTTMDNDRFHRLGFAASGVCTEYSVGQSDFLWFSRQLPGTRKLFRNLWDVESDDELVTSFDGCGAARNPFIPPRGTKLSAPRLAAAELKRVTAAVEADARSGGTSARTGRAVGGAGGAGATATASTAGGSDSPAGAPSAGGGAGARGASPTSVVTAGAPDTREWRVRDEWLTRGRWFHLDQNGNKKPNFDLWQGLLNYFPATGSSGSTVVVVGSHRDTFKRVFRGQKRSKGAFVLLNKPGDYETFCAGAVQVTLDAGDFMLWDSRVIHCNQGVAPAAGTAVTGAATAAMPGRETHPLARLVAYISMAPRARLSEKQSETRRKMVELGQTGTHQPVVDPDCHLRPRERTVAAKYKAPPKTSTRWKLV